MVEAIKAGMFQPAMKAEMDTLEARKAELTRKLETAAEPPPLLHPRLSDVYREKVESLTEALGQDDTRVQAAELLRGLISAVMVTPIDGVLAIDLQGDLAAMLAMAAGQKPPPLDGNGRSASQLALVAGTGNHRELTLPVVVC